MTHESTVEKESSHFAGVLFRIRRMSIARRIELTKRLRELGRKTEFLQAGTDHDQQMEAVLLGQEIDRTYLLWGLVSVAGLEIDGEQATPELLAAKGPEELCREVVDAVKAECHLSGEERKN